AHGSGLADRLQVEPPPADGPGPGNPACADTRARCEEDADADRRAPPPALPDRRPLQVVECRSRAGRVGLRARSPRQLDREGRATARRRVDPDAAVHPLDELPADVESQAAAADAVRLRRVEAVELLEDPLVLL